MADRQDTAQMDISQSSKSPQSKCSRIFPCRFEGCNSFFYRKSHLSRHELIHNDIRPFECIHEGCDKAFRSQSHLKRHESSHCGEKNFKCEYPDCNVACINSWSLKRHIKRTHEGTFKCIKCDKEFKKNKLLQNHVTLEHKRSVVVCTFPGCTHIFKNLAKMKFHQKLHAAKGYNCPVKDCSETFSLFSECRKHSAECKRKEKKCDVCGMVFTNRSNLKAHLVVHKDEREVFKCQFPECGRFYTKKHNLQQHVRSFHQTTQRFSCPKTHCSKTFHYKHSLRKHLENHGKFDKPTKQNKRKRPNRMITSNIAGITGYIPELVTKMTPAEMNAYVNNCEFDPACMDDTDIIPKDYETTQVEMTAMSSGDFSCLKTTENEEEMRIEVGENLNHYQEQQDLNQRPITEDESTESVLDASEETLTASLSADDLVILEPSTLEETSSLLDQPFNLAGQHRSSSSISSSRSNSPQVIYGAKEMSILNERLQQFACRTQDCTVVVEKSCSMQQSSFSKTDSESSDNERVLIQQLA